MTIHFNDSVDAIGAAFLNKENTLVVITPAIPKDHSEWNFFQKTVFKSKKELKF
jgi:UDP-N-acetylmuramate--alanine ligase